MANTVTVSALAVSNDGTQDRGRMAIATAALAIASAVVLGKLEPVALAAGFNALSPPTGAQGVMIRLVAGALTLTLKGITSDTGIAMQSGTLSTVPIVLPLGTTPSIGITASGAGGSVELFWF